MKWAATVRILRRATIMVAVLFVFLGVVLRIQTYLFRRQAENLMADFQSLKLRQTRWSEAENLTRKWGKYGHYQGVCNASFCRYTIDLRSPVEELAVRYGRLWDNRLIHPIELSLYRLSSLLGGRVADLRTTFVVQDAFVVRKSAVFSYQVPPSRGSEGYALIATSRATSRLSSDEYLLTYSDQLVKHPYYTYTRPGGCSFCLMANVSFTPDTPESEMRWLTTFNLACLTNFNPCRYLEDIYPASEGWHLYDDIRWGWPAPSNQVNSKVTVIPVECRVPIFARGREAFQIFSVTSLKESQEQQFLEVDEKATVRLDSVLKGSAEYSPGESIDLVSSIFRYYGRFEYAPLKIETPLTPGKHFLLLSMYGQKGREPIKLNRCLVLPDTPAIRAELQRGIAQNDTLRYPDPNARNFIPD